MVRLRPERQAPKQQGTNKEQHPADGTFSQENKATTDENAAEVQPVEVEVVPEKEQKEDETTIALKKQIIELQNAEKLAAKRANDAQKVLQERQAEWIKQQQEQARERENFERQSQEQEEVAVGAALAAATAEADKAQGDISRAMEAQDWSAFADAQRRLARAEANAARLQTGKEEIEARKKAPKQERPVEQPKQFMPGSDDHIDAMRLPYQESQWLRGHREYLTDPERGAQLTEANFYARKRGFEPGQPEYLQAVEKRLALLEDRQEEPKVEQEKEDRREEERQAAIVSAPVSRDVPNASGERETRRITLTAAQREMAKVSGITEADYAKQLIKLNKMKADGEYGERR